MNVRSDPTQSLTAEKPLHRGISSVQTIPTLRLSTTQTALQKAEVCRTEHRKKKSELSDKEGKSQGPAREARMPEEIRSPLFSSPRTYISMTLSSVPPAGTTLGYTFTGRI